MAADKPPDEVASDAAFLERYGDLIDQYLILGYAPASEDLDLWNERHDIESMREQLGDRYETLRRELAQGRARAKALLAQAGIDAVTVQYPAPAFGGPVLQQHLLDTVTGNIFERDVRKDRILDALNQAI